MLFFPSILPENSLQYPISRSQQYRFRQNVTPSGVVFRASDSGRRAIRWKLAFQNVSTEQRQQLDSFYGQCSGRLRSFVFLDPFSNMVRHSEAFENSVWGKDPGISVTTGQSDLHGTFRARRLSNPAGISRSIVQQLIAPAWFSYSVSCWLRSVAPVTVDLLLQPLGGSNYRQVIVTPEWQRFTYSAQSSSAEEAIVVGLGLPGNSEVFALGFQCEQFDTPSVYKESTDIGGVYSNCRFDHDEIRWATDGINHHSTQVTIRAPILS